MARHDPTPRGRTEAWARYKALMSWMALASVVAVLLALLWLWSTGIEMPVHLVIATAAGVGLSVLLGTALMGLVYFSSHSGHDEDVSRSDEYRD